MNISVFKKSNIKFVQVFIVIVGNASCSVDSDCRDAECSLILLPIASAVNLAFNPPLAIAANPGRALSYVKSDAFNTDPIVEMTLTRKLASTLRGEMIPEDEEISLIYSELRKDLPQSKYGEIQESNYWDPTGMIWGSTQMMLSAYANQELESFGSNIIYDHITKKSIDEAEMRAQSLLLFAFSDPAMVKAYENITVRVVSKAYDTLKNKSLDDFFELGITFFSGQIMSSVADLFFKVIFGSEDNNATYHRQMLAILETIAIKLEQNNRTASEILKSQYDIPAIQARNEFLGLAATARRHKDAGLDAEAATLAKKAIEMSESTILNLLALAKSARQARVESGIVSNLKPPVQHDRCAVVLLWHYGPVGPSYITTSDLPWENHLDPDYHTPVDCASRVGREFFLFPSKEEIIPTGVADYILLQSIIYTTLSLIDITDYPDARKAKLKVAYSESWLDFLQYEKEIIAKKWMLVRSQIDEYAGIQWYQFETPSGKSGDAFNWIVDGSDHMRIPDKEYFEKWAGETYVDELIDSYNLLEITQINLNAVIIQYGQ